MTPEREVDGIRERKREEREKLEKNAKKEMKMKPKISDTTLGALLPALQGKHGPAARSKALRALNAVLRSKAPAARAFDPQEHAAAVARVNTIESSQVVPGVRVWFEPGFQRFSACSPRQGAQ